MTEKLKPCPFCGGEKLIIDDGPCEDGVPCNWGRKEFFVYCSTCGGASGCKFTKEEAAEAWNRRVSDGEG